MIKKNYYSIIISGLLFVCILLFALQYSETLRQRIEKKNVKEFVFSQADIKKETINYVNKAFVENNKCDFNIKMENFYNFSYSFTDEKFGYGTGSYNFCNNVETGVIFEGKKVYQGIPGMVPRFFKITDENNWVAVFSQKFDGIIEDEIVNNIVFVKNSEVISRYKAGTNIFSSDGQIFWDEKNNDIYVNTVSQIWKNTDLLLEASSPECRLEIKFNANFDHYMLREICSSDYLSWDERKKNNKKISSLTLYYDNIVLEHSNLLTNGAKVLQSYGFSKKDSNYFYINADNKKYSLTTNNYHSVSDAPIYYLDLDTEDLYFVKYFENDNLIEVYKGDIMVKQFNAEDVKYIFSNGRCELAKQNVSLKSIVRTCQIKLEGGIPVFYWMSEKNIKKDGVTIYSGNKLQEWLKSDTLNIVFDEQHKKVFNKWKMDNKFIVNKNIYSFEKGWMGDVIMNNKGDSYMAGYYGSGGNKLIFNSGVIDEINNSNMVFAEFDDDKLLVLLKNDNEVYLEKYFIDN